MKQTLLNKLLTSIFALTTLCLSSSALAGLNKWVDEKGQTHYGDRVPAKYLTKEHSILNDQGVTLRTNKALKTEEELSEDAKLRAIEAEKNKQRLIEQRRKALRDRVLTDTFTTENDLIIARDERLAAIDSQISLAETLIQHDEDKLKVVKKRIEKIEKSGRKAPENLHKEVVSVSRQLEANYAYVEDRGVERKQILTTFEEDVKRFRELMEAKKDQKNQ